MLLVVGAAMAALATIGLMQPWDGQGEGAAPPATLDRIAAKNRKAAAEAAAQLKAKAAAATRAAEGEEGSAARTSGDTDRTIAGR